MVSRVFIQFMKLTGGRSLNMAQCLASVQAYATVVSQGLAPTIEPTTPDVTPDHPMIVVCADTSLVFEVTRVSPVERAGLVSTGDPMVVAAARVVVLSVSRLDIPLVGADVVETLLL